MRTDAIVRSFDPEPLAGARASRLPDSVRLHGRFYRAILWNANREAVETPPRRLVDRRV